MTIDDNMARDNHDDDCSLGKHGHPYEQLCDCGFDNAKQQQTLWSAAASELLGAAEWLSEEPSNHTALDSLRSAIIKVRKDIIERKESMRRPL